MGDIVQRVACKAVIVKDNKVLMLREANTYAEGTITGKYCFPGGRINPGEPFLEGLRREIREETGLEIEVGDPLSVDEWFPEIHGVSNQIVAIFFVCRPLSSEITLSEEHDAYQWCTYQQAKSLHIMPADDKALEKFFQKSQHNG